MTRTSFNPKRKIKMDEAQARLDELAARVRYTGDPEHKRNPGDFGLTPPSSPRPDKTLCDATGIFKDEAAHLLKEGIRRGLISEQWRGDFPRHVWSVSANGVPLEAELENQTLGTYYGYPMTGDPFAEQVRMKWQQYVAKLKPNDNQIET